ncbi:MAG: DsrE family protein [Gammaproteobacteria bacterium]|jgi:sulfur relay (sulfurtransferase) DsrF/TusC family protein|nr:hypothetical protein [Xanthomonadales bacterium]
MKALIFVTEHHLGPNAQWQYDRVMALLSYDYDVSLVFMNEGVSQLQSKMWNILNLMEINQVYVVEKEVESDTHLEYEVITISEIKELIAQADIVI